MNERMTLRDGENSPPALAQQQARVAAACGVPAWAWAQVLREARRLDTHPFDLALGEGVIEEARFIAVLARLAGVDFRAEPPQPLPSVQAEEAFAFRAYAGAGGQRVIAPDGAFADRLLAGKGAGSMEAGGTLLTTRQALLDALVAPNGDRLAQAAVHSLPDSLSARQWGAYWQGLKRLAPAAALMVALVVVAGGLVSPLAVFVLPPLLLSPLFILACIAVLTASLESLMPPRAMLPTQTAALPRYTVLVPIYREAGVVERLIERLGALHYPRDRLDVLFLVEAEDAETRAALRAQKLPASMLVLNLPEGAPRTKPRALNLGLAFARGDLVVVYDAEDAPEADQLLRAAALFRALPPHVACLQGRLGISNARDSWLARRFALDYAALFDCVKAGMGRSGWPVPLGGTSNHFRTQTLRRVGGWDAWNVTEDADLGIRLARLGYIVEDLPSTTWEEAPYTLRAWLNQRTRWMKGWMQTVTVHLSAPAALARSLGMFRLVMIGCIGLGVVLGALLFPFVVAGVITRLIDPTPLGLANGALAVADAMMALALGLAVLVEVVPAGIALWRRRALRYAPMILLAPLTHALVSWAAWRALAELLSAPFYWNKTTHGLARSEKALGALRSTRKRRRP